MNRLATLMSTISVLCLLLACRVVSASGVVSSPLLSSVGVQAEETSLGDLVADAVKQAAETPIAVLAAGSLKEITIAAGKIKAKDVIDSLQYPDDKIAVVELTGKQLLSALERSVQIHPQKNMGFLQVSGLKVEFAPGSPEGSRIASVEVGGEKLSQTKKYAVAMTVPLAQGDYGYFTIWGKEKRKPVDSVTLSGAVSNFLSTKTSVDYKEKTRITIK